MNPQNIKIKRENFDNYFEKFDNYFERLHFKNCTNLRIKKKNSYTFQKNRNSTENLRKCVKE